MTTFVLLVLAISLLARKRFRPARHITLAATCLLILWTWPPFTWLFAGTLEWQYPIHPAPPGDAQAIVALSANLYPRDPSQPAPVLGFSTYLRCRHALWLYRNWKRLPIVVTGGQTSAEEPATLADVMAGELEDAGVPAAQVWREREAGTTHESAVKVAAMLRSKGIQRIALVTEAIHMPRAERAFRRQGIEVTPAPCAYRTERFRKTWKNFLPRPSEALENDANLHEWLGLLSYLASGKCDRRTGP